MTLTVVLFRGYKDQSWLNLKCSGPEIPFLCLHGSQNPPADTDDNIVNSR